MSAVGERGEGKLSTVIWLLVFAAVAFAIWHVAPVYIDHYALVDKANELARAPRYNNPDEKIIDQLTRYAREERIPGVGRHSFALSTLETSRRITVEYQREAEVLPGWKHTFKFSNTVEQPLIY